MRRVFCSIMLIGLLGTPAGLSAQSVGIAAHVSTLGLGGDVGLHFGRVGLRVGGNFFPFDIDASYSNIDYTINLPSPQWTAMLDLYLVGGLRATGGLLFSSPDIDVLGKLATAVNIGGTMYTPAQVGTLKGSIINDDVSPYVGIGFGGPGSSRFGFFLDLGVAFQGTPAVALSADGPIANDPLLGPVFLADLNAEAADFENDISFFKVYPVVSIGFTIGFN